MLYSGYKSVIIYVICKFFVLFCGLSFHFLSVISRAKVFNFDEVYQFFVDYAFGVMFKNFLLSSRFLLFFSKSFLVLVKQTVFQQFKEN